MTDALPQMENPAELKKLLEDIMTPGELRTLLDAPGVTDEVVNEFVTAVGTEKVLDRVFGLMGEHFVADRAGTESGVVQWNIDTAGGTYSYHLVIADGTAVGRRGAADRPRVSLTLSAPTLLHLCAGKLEGVTAFMSGKVKLSGDMMFGAKMASWFDY